MGRELGTPSDGAGLVAGMLSFGTQQLGGSAFFFSVIQKKEG